MTLHTGIAMIENNVESTTHFGKSQRRTALVLMFWDGDQCPPHKVAHLCGSPQDKHDDGRCLSRQIPAKSSRRTKVKQEK